MTYQAEAEIHKSDELPHTILLHPFNNHGHFASQPYTYQPLDRSKRQFRLFILHLVQEKAKNDASTSSCLAVHCDLTIHNIDSAPPYIALSYVWGDTSPTQVIHVNGQQFVVRQNLFDFLTTFVHDCGNVFHLWVDQICIDQTSKSERNYQVQMMSDIYSRRNCQCVIAWLGLESKTVAEQFLESPYSAEQYFESPYRSATHELLLNRYFTRLWIVQEILLASRIRILCGDNWIVWEQLTDAVMHAFLPGKVPPAGWIFDIRQAGNQRKPQLSLAEALAQFAWMGCQDPRDKFYGLLGIVETPDSSRARVDYSKSLESIFCDIINIIANPSHQVPSFTTETIVEHMRLARDMKLDDRSALQLELLYHRLYKRVRTQHGTRSWLVHLGYEESSKRWWYEHDGKRHFNNDRFASLRLEVERTLSFRIDVWKRKLLVLLLTRA
ncbi:HET-domain-containing protein [Setomelanomma holmii]|uniref:HET-domain-containing protein n=1 Tax=Setomelanomma holmii TaxID=210430 RepID=A0A9P4HD82_9PLEO|nr:HET-domain-containing protein [Setomelanomma holmii]